MTTWNAQQNIGRKSLRYSLVLFLLAYNSFQISHCCCFYLTASIHNVKGSSTLSLTIYILKLFSYFQEMFSSIQTQAKDGIQCSSTISSFHSTPVKLMRVFHLKHGNKMPMCLFYQSVFINITWVCLFFQLNISKEFFHS